MTASISRENVALLRRLCPEDMWVLAHEDFGLSISMLPHKLNDLLDAARTQGAVGAAHSDQLYDFARRIVALADRGIFRDRANLSLSAVPIVDRMRAILEAISSEEQFVSPSEASAGNAGLDEQ